MQSIQIFLPGTKISPTNRTKLQYTSCTVQQYVPYKVWGLLCLSQRKIITSCARVTLSLKCLHLRSVQTTKMLSSNRWDAILTSPLNISWMPSQTQQLLQDRIPSAKTLFPSQAFSKQKSINTLTQNSFPVTPLPAASNILRYISACWAISKV